MPRSVCGQYNLRGFFCLSHRQPVCLILFVQSLLLLEHRASPLPLPVPTCRRGPHPPADAGAAVLPLATLATCPRLASARGLWCPRLQCPCHSTRGAVPNRGQRPQRSPGSLTRRGWGRSRAVTARDPGCPPSARSARRAAAPFPLPQTHARQCTSALTPRGLRNGSGRLILCTFLAQIYVPLMLVNAADDPLVHESLLTIPKSLSGECWPRPPR